MREPTLWGLGVLSLQITATTGLALLPAALGRREALAGLPYNTSSNTGAAGYSYTELPSGVRIYGQTAAAQARDIFLPRLDASGHRSRRGGGGTAASSIRPSDSAGWCDDTWYSNDGSDNSPLVSDCQVIATQVYELGGASNAYFGRSECSPDSTGEFTCYYPVVAYGTCLFGASTVSAGTGVSVRIGWNDVGDVISDSVAQFGGNPAAGKVGASGEMDCPDEVTGVTMYLTGWGVYHS